ncbi:MAG TPA: patatin-like phospholipase family protein, partial [Thermoanaerobaculia bacterium]|nr:patatin-like phospholipase family protein [Thermoanaerobaculia bacterium]
LTFSGGGTRAAALSYGVLKELKGTPVKVDGQTKPLLSEVDIISSISGGSFTAAYYGLFGDRIFADFESRFLKRKVQNALILRFLAPWNWPRLWSPYFDRIDLAAEYYDQEVFDRRTFKSLAERNQTPFILLNATDIAHDSRFEFTQDQFDLFCSDLSGYPVARAVAASSAFPFALSPLTLKAYPRQCGYQDPAWLASAREEREDGSRRFYNAQLVDAYLNPRTQYVHLLDGGLADNLGLRGPLASLFSTDNPRSAPDEVGDRSILQKINLKKVDTLLVIAVNARTRSEDTIGQQRKAPGILGMVGPVANGPMGNYSYETMELLKESMRQWTTDVEQEAACREIFQENCQAGELPQDFLQKVAYYPVEVTFDSIADPARREHLQSLATSFQLPPGEIDELVKAAADLLRQNPEFQRFLKDFAP